MAKNTIADLSTTAASNLDVAGDGIAGTDLVSKGDNVIRGALALLKKWWNDLNGQVTVGGTANAVTVTSSSVYQALVAGIGFRFVATAENTAAATLTLDSLTAKAVRKIVGGTDVALAAGDITVGRRCDVVYDTAANSAAGAWILTNPANVYVSSASLTPASVTSLDNGASAGPVFDYFRDSASPAASDSLAEIDFTGRSSTAVKRVYASIAASIFDPTNAAELGRLKIGVLTSGVATTYFDMVGNSLNVGTGMFLGIDTTGGLDTNSGSGSIPTKRPIVPRTDGATALGDSTHTWTDVFTSHVVFPAAQSASAGANTLDDYEEGTFTPGVAFGGGTTGITYTTQLGYYRKIGQIVVGSVSIVLSSKGSSSGSLTITGLPFTSLTGPVGLAAWATYSAMTGLTGAPLAYVGSNGTVMNITQSGAAVSASVTDAACTNTSTMFIGLAYIAAA